MPKVINISKAPYEFTFDAGNYGPIQPGEIVDFPAEVAAHCIRRSEIIDPELGDTVGYRMAYLDDVSKEQVRSIVTYPCPFVMSKQCMEQPFKSVDDLRKHLETHWASNVKPEVVNSAPASPLRK